MRTLRALVALLGGFLIVGFLVTAMTDDDGWPWQFRSSRGLVVVLAGLAIVVGWAAATRRRRPSVGPLMMLCAYVALIGAASHAPDNSFGAAVWLAGLGLPAVIVLGHPNGMRKSERWPVLAVLAALAALGIAAVATAGEVSPALVAREPGDWPTPSTAGRVLFGAHTVVVVLAAVALILVCVKRLQRRPLSGRGLVNPVLVGGMVWAGLLAPGQAIQQWDGYLDAEGRITDEVWTVAVNGPLIGLLVLFSTVAYVELVRPVLGRTRAGAVMVRGDSLGAVREHLARWLQDPTVRLGFADRQGAWVDSEGRPFVPDETFGRAVTTLVSDDSPVAVVEHRADLVEQPGVIESGATTVALALEADRQVAVARSNLADARRLGARLLLADDVARTELAERLDAGPALDLRRLAADVEKGGDLAHVARDLRRITAAVRTISHGLLPPELEGGLRPALGRTVDVPERRFDPAVEITAYLLAHDDEQARIEDHGTELRVILTEPPADQRLRDRVDALGGWIEGAAVSLPLQV